MPGQRYNLTRGYEPRLRNAGHGVYEVEFYSYMHSVWKVWKGSRDISVATSGLVEYYDLFIKHATKVLCRELEGFEVEFSGNYAKTVKLYCRWHGKIVDLSFKKSNLLMGKAVPKALGTPELWEAWKRILLDGDFPIDNKCQL